MEYQQRHIECSCEGDACNATSRLQITPIMMAVLMLMTVIMALKIKRLQATEYCVIEMVFALQPTIETVTSFLKICL